LFLRLIGLCHRIAGLTATERKAQGILKSSRIPTLEVQELLFILFALDIYRSSLFNMFARSGVLSLAIALFSNQASALDLDVNNKGTLGTHRSVISSSTLTNADSITAAVKTLADGVFAAYKKPLEETRTPGLFGKEYSWWESGNTWTELIEYSYLTGDQQYNDAIAKALWHQRGDFDAFMPPNQTKFLGNNDQSFWGLASLTAHETGLQKPPQGEWIDFAANVWNTQSARWDTQICNGGLRNQIFAFNNGYTERNSITNGNFFLLSARLAHLTGNTTYQDWATKVFAWSKEVGLVSNESHVFESTDSTDNCSTVVQDQWTNNHAMYTEGAALMYNLVSFLRNFDQDRR
jgi:mannan endo-1,6-alpha-mannosidase